MNKTRLYNILFLIGIVFIIIQCANPVSPEGGPKDEEPPQILKMNPPNYATDVVGVTRLSVQFNEFVRLLALSGQLMISPPLSETPNIRTKGKSVIIDIKEPLRDSTTYTFFFGNSIVDITESNPLSNFEYVFSTGPLLDSMAVRGKLFNAFDMKPVEGIAILLYDLSIDTIPLDSLPLLSLPMYVSRTNAEGEFELNNLRNIPYKIVGLKDMNSNYLYDLPNEEIAFLDSTIMPAFLGRKDFSQAIDSLNPDSTKVVEEGAISEEIEENSLFSSAIDSLSVIDSIAEKTPSYEPIEMFLFPVIDSTQEILEAVVSKGSLITFKLKFPCKEFEINPINFIPEFEWNIIESNKTNTLIYCWPWEGVRDSLQLEFVADSIVLDTIKFVLNKINPNANIDTTKIERIVLSNNLIRNKEIELGQKLIIEPDFPISEYNFSKIIWVEDTIISNPEIVFLDSTYRRFYVNKELSEGVNYKMTIPDSALFDTKARTNDTIIYKFTTQLAKDFGTISLAISIADTNQQWIVQLLDNQDKVIKEDILVADSLIVYNYMPPTTYNIKAVLDRNKNGFWDTGSYILKRQAEKVLLFKSEIKVRANWILDEVWELK
ncbi:MAG: Ig-like domain-containing protein [Bacteroidetes bacterium]|nr:Ig-like domain-containing protein [Bacteroidota bacterium]